MNNYMSSQPTRLAASLLLGLCSVSAGFVMQGWGSAAIALEESSSLAVEASSVEMSSPEASTEASTVEMSSADPQDLGAPLDQASEPSADVVGDLAPEEIAIVEPVGAIAPESATATEPIADVQHAADFTEATSASVLSTVEVDRSLFEGSMAQVTSVNQLSDVRPTDWAYQALSSLIDRYGCIAGYPDGTFRGGAAMTRYEFAAGLNACLEGFAASLSPDDMSTLQQLQQDFADELADLRNRVDSLEAQISLLEANQFSTTSKLSGLAFFHLGFAGADGDVLAETGNLDAPLNLRPAARNSITGDPIVARNSDDPEVTFGYLVWLNLNTSFTGDDLLVTQLVVGNGASPANEYVSAGLFNTYGVPFTDQSGGTADDDVAVRELFYDFPIGDSVRVAVGPRINWYRYFDGNAYTFFLTGASSFNSSGGTQLNSVDRGAGAVVRWDISDKFDLALGYLGENTEFLPGAFFNTATDPSNGLFGATNTLSVGLAYSPSSSANIRFTYSRSLIEANAAIRDENGNITGFGVGGAISEPIYGVADDGFGGSIEDAEAHTFSANFDWRVTDWLGLFSRYTYATMDIDPVSAARSGGSIDSQSFQAGLAFPDLGKEGALLTLSYLIPFSILDGEEFMASGAGDGGIQYEFEATYFYPLGNNISLAPSLYIINNANNFDSNPTIWVANLRMQFAF